MCSLCGALGAEERWADGAGREGLGQGGMTRRQERQRRIMVANRVLGHYGLRLTDFAGQSYVLQSRTGRTLIAHDLAAVWQAAETLAGRACDPLDPALLAKLQDPR